MALKCAKADPVHIIYTHTYIYSTCIYVHNTNLDWDSKVAKKRKNNLQASNKHKHRHTIGKHILLYAETTGNY